MAINYQLMGKRVKEHRFRQQLRQEALAWEAEISASYLSCIENGIKQASLSSIVRIADALGVTAESLLFGETTPESDSAYQALYAVLNGCEEFERKIIMDTVLGTASAAKRSLRANGVYASEN